MRRLALFLAAAALLAVGYGIGELTDHDPPPPTTRPLMPACYPHLDPESIEGGSSQRRCST